MISQTLQADGGSSLALANAAEAPTSKNFSRCVVTASTTHCVVCETEGSCDPEWLAELAQLNGVVGFDRKLYDPNRPYVTLS